ncbi:MAG: glycosyltransferase family 2 protein [Pyrinomonadaceae bacterium]
MTSSPAAESRLQKSSDSVFGVDNQTVSVVIPCFNEERFIGKALEQLADQYDQERYEILVVDGHSEDRTRAVVAEFKTAHPDVSITVIDNPARNIPTALNLGIAEARGNIIARMDAHAMPSAGYIRRCVEVLQQEDVGVVGMPCHVRAGAGTLTARAIAAAVSHPFGIGDAKYRLTEGGLLQQPVDTVAFACFKKSLWLQLNGYNESLLTNEDYDFNYRVRLTGQLVILDRSGHCDYFARTTVRNLARQYLRYGRWKARMIKLHPGSIKLRHLVAPAFVLSLALLSLLGVFWTPLFGLLALEVAVYAVFALGFGWQAMKRSDAGIDMWLVMPLIFLTIHLAWGASFLLGLFRQPRSA